jgi:hypothetical protein
MAGRQHHYDWLVRNKLAMLYDGVEGTSTSHMRRDIYWSGLDAATFKDQG